MCCSCFVRLVQNAWRLADLQNKDNGELPLLHVYELDSVQAADDPAVGAGEKAENAKFSEAQEAEKEPGVESSTDCEAEKKSINGDSDDVKKEDRYEAIDEGCIEKRAAVTNGNDEDDNGGEKASMATRCSFLAIAQRRSEVYSREVLHPLTHYVFGTPLLMRVLDLDNLTNSEVYDMVATRLKNFVPSSVLKFLEQPSGSEETEAISEPAVVGEKSKAEIRQHLTKTMTDMEDVAAGPVPRYGFRLRLASRDGRRCALCPWYDCCIGCLVPDDNAPTVISCGDSMVIDWHFAVDVATNGFGSRSAQVDHTVSAQSPFRARIPSLPIKNHSSCGTGLKGQGYPGAISLEDCLDAFAKEEKIPEVSILCSRRVCFDFLPIHSLIPCLRSLRRLIVQSAESFEFNRRG